MSFHILYQDTDVLAIQKPAGLLVHPDMSGKPAVTDWILKQFPDSARVGEPARLPNGAVIIRPGIVHRLDTETSGVLLIALTDQGYAHLKEQFQNRTIQKTYHAFVYGSVTNDTGAINRPIGRSSKNFKLWSAQRGARGVLRDALTEYKTHFRSDEVSFLEIFPKTGRTHQIRVHMKAINHPVVCDSLYAPKHKPMLGFSRLALHARAIEFENSAGKRMSVLAPYPEDFVQAMAGCGIVANF